ncbi:3'-5' exonuclease (plasmid) [Rhodococcus pyridinivorans]|uniref:3'-5' exonuclease n=1 Tax=Rhodococcus pyridinivorans TaxID=103816 RepID=UPI00200B63FD|nr:3'-5' exonuclease [Rhodococcus pyridinivorans]UPW06972.1 3'-5' exonuclease [Rhodococcus pyridinivorans]
MPLQTHTPRAWANAVLADGAACIVDVETSGLDGSIIEIAVIDAETGEVLLNTLVDCSPVEIEPGAVEVHGLTATDLAGAPRWSEVFPELAAATKNRVVLVITRSSTGAGCCTTVDGRVSIRRIWPSRPAGSA